MGTPARRVSTIIAMVLTALALAACSADPAPTAPPAPVPTAPATPATTITATNFDFGAPITVSPGTIVTFVNNDETRHNVTSDDDGKAFASPTVVKATTTFRAPTTPGSYPFHCTYHTVMHGTLIVK